MKKILSNLTLDNSLRGRVTKCLLFALGVITAFVGMLLLGLMSVMVSTTILDV